MCQLKQNLGTIGTSIKEEWKLSVVAGEYVKSTEKAVLVNWESDMDAMSDKTWIPKSLIKDVEEANSEEFAFVVPTWWAIQNAPRKNFCY